jgi:dihydroorotate dehydrogenase electron transfer subunit
MPIDPRVFNGDAIVVRQENYGPGCWKMVMDVPSAAPIEAGQFCHIRVDEAQSDPLLRRPFSYWDVREGKAGHVEADILYTVVGRGTEILAAKRQGERIGYLGAVGRGFTVRRDKKAYLFVAGGVGIVPFYLFAKRVRAAGCDARLILAFGARNEKMLWGIDDFPGVGVECHAATDDGSRGRKGLVTQVMSEWLEKLPKKDVMVYACGPDRMLEAVIEHVQKSGHDAEVSMERRMGCALGACGACVTPVRDGDDWRYSRICIEGPTYDARELVLHPEGAAAH